MAGIERAFELLALLEQLGYPAALVGGHAVSIRTRERFTKDFDFAVAVASDQEAEELAFAMQERNFRLHTLIEQAAKQLVGTLRFVDPLERSEDPTIDILCASCGIEREIVAASTTVSIARGLSLQVATIPYLLATKVLSVSETRKQDLLDLEALFAVASEPELATARKAVGLIQERGFNRTRDLPALFEEHLRALRPD